PPPAPRTARAPSRVLSPSPVPALPYRPRRARAAPGALVPPPRGRQPGEGTRDRDGRTRPVRSHGRPHPAAPRRLPTARNEPGAASAPWPDSRRTSVRALPVRTPYRGVDASSAQPAVGASVSTLITEAASGTEASGSAES